MAVVKIKHSKGSLKKIIEYVMDKEKTDEKFISGKDCLPESVFESMSATKDTYNKTDGRSYCHIIQSFKPGEVGPTMAREIGKELAEKQFKGYEVLIATHIDKEHIHNHLVINSVSFEDGRKLHSSMQDFRELKKESDRICSDRGLSVIEKPYARNHYSMAEYKLAEKGQPIWKEQLRSAIDEAKEHSATVWEMKDYLEKNFNIDMKIQAKNFSFLHPDKQKYCRGSKLGNDYTREEIFKSVGRDPEPKKEEIDRTIPGESKSGFGLSKVGFGIESIANKISKDIEKEQLRADQKKVIKARGKAEERERDRDGGRDRDRGYRGR